MRLWGHGGRRKKGRSGRDRPFLPPRRSDSADRPRAGVAPDLRMREGPCRRNVNRAQSWRSSARCSRSSVRSERSTFRSSCTDSRPPRRSTDQPSDRAGLSASTCADRRRRAFVPGRLDAGPDSPDAQIGRPGGDRSSYVRRDPDHSRLCAKDPNLILRRPLRVPPMGMRRPDPLLVSGP
jgi:hypothetical protein